MISIIPTEFISDNGAEFKNKFFNEFSLYITLNSFMVLLILLTVKELFNGLIIVLKNI